MQIIETKVYSFDELSDEAKEKARDWYRKGGLDYEGWDFILEDAKRIGIQIDGFDLYHGTICGSVDDPIETIRAILADHGTTCETYKTARAALREHAHLRQRWWNTVDQSEYSISEFDYESENADDWAANFRYDILEDYRIFLQEEQEYLESNESIDANIRANEYTFTAEGRRFG